MKFLSKYKTIKCIASCSLFAWCLISIFLLSSSLVQAAGGKANYLYGDFKPDYHDLGAMQRGALNYVYYCSGCHSLEHMRFNRMSRDIGITYDDGTVLEPVLLETLMLTTDKVGDQLHIGMQRQDAIEWFGGHAPDLSLIERARGSTWMYNYLLSFYQDSARPLGANNVVFPNVGMPHVLVDLMGVQAPIFEKGHEGDVNHIIGLETIIPGEMEPDEYQMFVADLVTFLAYVADQNRVERHRLGVYVILFLVFLACFAYLLRREYWKDVK